MKLLNCHIENYGSISGFRHEFTDGINQMVLGNGAGKTTFTSFICAMLYGLASYSARTKTFTERQHFYPFGGGNFGGSLELLTDSGALWRIERTFGEKSATDDKIRVTVDGREADLRGVEPGVKIFGLDAESFRRTVFMTSDDLDIGSTGGINAKLGKFTDGDDGANAETAVSLIEDEYKKLRPSRGQGLIDRENAAVMQLKGETEDIKRTAAQLEKDYAARADLAKKKSRAELALKEGQTANAAARAWKTYDVMADEASRITAKITEMDSVYPKGIPDSSVTDRLAAVEEKKSEIIMRRKQSARLSDADRERLTKLGFLFREGIPSDESIDGVKKLIDDSVSLLGEAKGAAEDAEPDAEALETAGHFTAGVPDEKTLAGIAELSKQYSETEKSIAEKNSASREALERAQRESAANAARMHKILEADDTADSLKESYEKQAEITAKTAAKRTGFIVAGALALAVGAAGAALTVLGVPVKFTGAVFIAVLAVCAAAAIAGIALLLVGIIKFTSDKSKSEAEEKRLQREYSLAEDTLASLKNTPEQDGGRRDAERLKLETEALEEGKKRIGERIKAVTVRYGFLTEDHPDSDVLSLISAVSKYKTNTARQAEKKEKAERLASEASGNIAEASRFLSMYFTLNKTDPTTLGRAADTLRSIISEYKDLSERDRIESEETVTLDAALSETLEEEKNIFAECGFKVPDDPRTAANAPSVFSSDRKTYMTLKNDFADISEKAAKFRLENDLTVRPASGETADLAALENAVTEASRNVDAMDAKIADEEETASKLPEKRKILDDKQLNVSNMKYRADVLKTAENAIKTAEENLKHGYIEPVLKLFMFYAGKAACFTGDRVKMDPDCRITFEQNGAERQDGYLSHGQRTVYSLCLRLALTDRVFEGAKPFMVMDDPFIALDGEHMGKCGEALAALAGDRQIIYFTCHESRKIVLTET